MVTSSDGKEDTVLEGESASDDRIQVLIRLQPDQHRDMRLAMAMKGIRTNQEFGEAALVEKIRGVLRRKADRADLSA